MLVLYLCLLLEWVIGSEEQPVDSRSHVTVLTETVFDSFLTSKSVSLVQFYAPWCVHCQKLAPEYERAARVLTGEADLAKVDCTLNKQLCEKYQIKGFPTLYLMRSDGFYEPYEGERDTDTMVRYMRKQSRPPFAVLNTQAEIAEFRFRDFVAITWLREASGPEFIAFQSMANSLRMECDFGLVVNPELFTRHARPKDNIKIEDVLPTQGEAKNDDVAILVPALIVYKTFDEREVAFSGQWSGENLRNFVLSESFPLVGGIGPANYSKYIQRNLPILWLFVNPESEASAQAIVDVETVSKEFKGKISTVALDGVRWHQHARSLGAQGTPSAVIQVPKRNENFVLSEPLSVTSLRTHVVGVLDSTISPTLKSQDIPRGKEGNVTVLVGKNFEQVTQDSSKTVFVMFFAPWCGHCKSVLPKWMELADLLANSSDVIIAKLDVTANDVRIPLQGVPTFVLFSGGTSVVFDGDREISSLHRFLTEHVPSVAPLKQEL